MSGEENRDAPGFGAEEPPETVDAVMVIRAWREGGSEDRATWHWRGQISHDQTTKRFVGLSMLFDVIGTMLGKVANAREDGDG